MQTNRYIVLVFFLLLVNLNRGEAQAGFSGAQVLNTDLPASSEARLIARDKEGFYWLGGSSGLYRFDGQQSKHYAIQSLDDTVSYDQYIVSNGFIDSSGVLWFSTYMALHSFDLEKEEFASYQADAEGKALVDKYFVFFFDTTKNELLLRAGPSLWSFSIQDKTFRLQKDVTQANSIAPIATESGVVFWGAPWWNDQTSLEYHFYSSGGIAESKTIEVQEMIKRVVAYRQDSIFLCTPAGLRLMVNPGSDGQRRIEPVIDGDCYNVAIAADRNTVFASISGKGVFSVGAKSLRVAPVIDSVNGLRTNSVRTLRVSDDGPVFATHEMYGMDVVLPAVEDISFRSGPPGRKVEDIIKLDDGSILLTDQNGSFWRGEIDKRKTTNWEKLPAGKSLDVLPDRARFCRTQTGRLYALGHESLLELYGDGVVRKGNSLPFSLYRGIISTKQDELIFLRMNTVMLAVGDDPPQPLPGIDFGEADFFSTIMKVSEDRFLLCYREVELWDVVRNGDRWEVRTKHALPGEMRAIAPVGNKIYFGTSAGLLLLEEGGLTEVFDTPSTNGMLWINALHADAAGRIWLGTRQGLFCYKPREDEYLFFGKADGLGDDWFVQANIITEGDDFTMATRTGLVTINPRLADENVSANNIYLSDVWVNGIRQKDHSPYAPKPIDEDFRHNSISFLPGMIELSSSSLSGFHYQLEGLEDSVTYSKAGETIRYPSLPHGNFAFRFYGVDRNGRTTEPIVIPVTISPPFYLKKWFWGSCALLVVGVFYFISRRAVRKETDRQESLRREETRMAAEKLARHKAVVTEQRRIMMELHDDLGGTLGSLFYTLDGYLLDQVSGLPVEPDFELLKNTSGDAMKQLRAVMKSNTAREMPLPMFIRTLTEQARTVAISSRMNWDLEQDSQFPDVLLSSQQVHNALLISKEALQNIRKHAQATAFTLKLHLQGIPANALSITLTDDGIGIGEVSPEQREDGTGNGLRNMQRRAEDLNGTLILNNLPEGGTRMELSFPLVKAPPPESTSQT